MSTALSPFSPVIPTGPLSSLCVKVFWPFANTHNGEWLLTWNNSQCTPKTPNEAAFLQEQLNKNVELGHYSEPFGPDLLPGMYSVPTAAGWLAGWQTRRWQCEWNLYTEGHTVHLVGQEENWLKEGFKHSFCGPPGGVWKEVAGKARCSLVAIRPISLV